jgi:hypothetical protein
VNGNPKMRVPLFRLSLSHARLKAGRHSVHATRISVRLTKVAAGALDSALGASLYTPGMRLGTAATLLRF